MIFQKTVRSEKGSGVRKETPLPFNEEIVALFPRFSSVRKRIVLEHKEIWVSVYCFVSGPDYNWDYQKFLNLFRQTGKEDKTYDRKGNKRECKKICASVLE